MRAIEGDGSWLLAMWVPWKGTSVETWLVPPHEDTPLWHIRIHRIKRDVVRTGGERVLVGDAGFAIYAQGVDGRWLALVEDDDVSGKRLLNCYGNLEGVDTSVGLGATHALIRSAAGGSGVVDPTQKTSRHRQCPSRIHPTIFPCPQRQGGAEISTRKGQVIHLDSNANIVSLRSCMPSLIGEYGAKETVVNDV